MSFEHHRGNLIDWIYFFDQSQHQKEQIIVAILGDSEYDLPIFERMKYRADHLSDSLENNVKYDAVFYPRLTKNTLSEFNDSIEDLLLNASSHLKPSGIIAVGFNNLNSIRSLSGVSDDTDVVSVCFQDLKTLSQDLSNRFQEVKSILYYPMPSLEVALNLYTDDWLPGDEYGQTYSRISSQGLFKELAPAYLFIVQFGNISEKNYPIYIKYDSSRVPEYAIRTEILKDEKLHVVKESIYPAANNHIRNLNCRIKLMQESNLSVYYSSPESFFPSHDDNHLSAIQLPFIEGIALDEILARHISDGQPPYSEISSYIKQILGVSDGKIQPANFDSLFENIILKDGKLYAIDNEWISPDGYDSKFLEFRILKYWYQKYHSSLNVSEEEFYGHFLIKSQDISEYESREKNIQFLINGSGEDSNISVFYDQEITAEKYKEAVSQKEYYAQIVSRQTDEIEERNNHIKELDHQISELNVMQENAAEELKEKDEAIVDYQKEITVFNQKIDENNKSINSLLGEINELKESVNSLLRVTDENHQRIAKLQQSIYKIKHPFFYLRMKIKEKMHRLKEKCKNRFHEKYPVGSRKWKYFHYLLHLFKEPKVFFPRIFTSHGRNLMHGDFNIGQLYLDHGKVVFPVTEAPEVSIVIPCYNQLRYTYACLLSIKEHTDFEKTPYEIIIADDVSTDDTKNISRYASNLVIARNEVNQGFLKNCNQAAAKARGKYILFLNNDTTVSDHWLDSLTGLMESDSSIGMVGSKLVYPDGRLQEAGGIIWSDGSGWNYGRLQDAGQPQFNYVKEVDYISGAAIMIRKELWEEIGGFDERFAPAYCEDSDLAFEVRKHGKKVVYQPASVVTHYEGISNGTDVNGSGLKRYQVINNEKFREKWAEELSRQAKGPEELLIARDRGYGKKYILFVDHYVPTFDQDAGSKTAYEYIRMMIKNGYRVIFVGDNFAKMEPYTSVLQQMGVEVLYGNEAYFNFWKWFDENHQFIHVAYLNRPHIAIKYIDKIRKYPDIRVIYYGEDFAYLRISREYEVTRNPEKKAEAEKFREMEFSLMRKADVSYFPSQAEVDMIHKMDPTIKAKAIDAFIYSDQAAVNENWAEREGLLFVGGFVHDPNRDGIIWFVKEILPKVREKIPGIRVMVAGSHPNEEIRKLGETEGVNVLGYVSDEDLERLYQNTRIVIAPLRYGAGVKGKVMQALYEGSPLVTTTIGAEGIPGIEKIAWIGDSADAFAEAVITHYDDTEALKQASEKAVKFIEENYSQTAAWKKISSDFQ